MTHIVASRTSVGLRPAEEILHAYSTSTNQTSLDLQRSAVTPNSMGQEGVREDVLRTVESLRHIAFSGTPEQFSFRVRSLVRQESVNQNEFFLISSLLLATIEQRSTEMANPARQSLIEFMRAQRERTADCLVLAGRIYEQLPGEHSANRELRGAAVDLLTGNQVGSNHRTSFSGIQTPRDFSNASEALRSIIHVSTPEIQERARITLARLFQETAMVQNESWRDFRRQCADVVEDRSNARMLAGQSQGVQQLRAAIQGTRIGAPEAVTLPLQSTPPSANTRVVPTQSFTVTPESFQTSAHIDPAPVLSPESPSGGSISESTHSSVASARPVSSGPQTSTPPETSVQSARSPMQTPHSTSSQPMPIQMQAPTTIQAPVQIVPAPLERPQVVVPPAVPSAELRTPTPAIEQPLSVLHPIGGNLIWERGRRILELRGATQEVSNTDTIFRLRRGEGEGAGFVDYRFNVERSRWEWQTTAHGPPTWIGTSDIPTNHNLPDSVAASAIAILSDLSAIAASSESEDIRAIDQRICRHDLVERYLQSYRTANSGNMLEIRYNARQEQYEFRVFREPPTAATQASIPFAPLTENTAVPGNLSPVSRRTFTEVQGILRGQAGSFLPTLDRNQEMFTFLSLLGQEEGYSGREGNGAWRRSWNFPGSNLSISFNGDTGRFQYSMEQTPLHRRQWTDITRNSPLPHLGVDSQFDRSLRADAQLRRDNYTFERVRDALTAARTPESNALCAQLARSTELLNGVFRPASANAQFANLYSCPIGYQSSVSGGTTVFLSPVLEAGQITWFYSISNGSNRVPGWGSFRPISEFNPEQFGEVAQNQTAIQASLALNGLRNSQTQSAQYAIRAIRDGLQILSGVPVGISRPFRENWSGFDSTHVRLTTRGIAGAPQSDRHTEFRFNSENSRWQWREPQGDWITIGESDRPWYSEAEGSDPANVLLNSLGRRLQLLR